MFKSKSEDLELLLVVDDLDIIKIYMHQIKESLQSLKPKPRILTRSVYDAENEKSSIRCKKVLFLISNITQSLKTKVECWCKQLPLIKGNPKKFMIICSGKVVARVTSPKEILICVENLAGIADWWPFVLKFLYKGNMFRNRFSESDYFILNLSCEDKGTCETDVLDKTVLTKGTDEKSAKCVIVLSKQMDLEVQNVLLALIKQRKRRNKSIHIVCTQQNKSEILRYTDAVFSKTEFLKFFLWLYIDLGLINATRKDVQQICSKVLLLKVLGAALWPTVGLPVMLFFDCLTFAVIVIAVIVLMFVSLVIVLLGIGKKVVPTE